MRGCAEERGGVSGGNRSAMWVVGRRWSALGRERLLKEGGLGLTSGRGVGGRI